MIFVQLINSLIVMFNNGLVAYLPNERKKVFELFICRLDEGIQLTLNKFIESFSSLPCGRGCVQDTQQHEFWNAQLNAIYFCDVQVNGGFIIIFFVIVLVKGFIWLLLFEAFLT